MNCVISYEIRPSKEQEWKWVVFKRIEKGNGCCYIGVYHSNDREECNEYIKKMEKNDKIKEKTKKECEKQVSQRNRARKKNIVARGTRKMAKFIDNVVAISNIKK